MLKASLSRGARKALARLPQKHARQIATRILDLRSDPSPHDSSTLKGSPGFRRVDIGEYRIIYRAEGQELQIAAIGRRNDDAIYKEFERSKKR
jgi:mRNA interferase RelE/StbE